MHKPKILITAASGKTAGATARQLLAAGYPVRALVHRDDARSAQLRAAGADVITGSLEDPVDLRAALTGVHRAYFCPPLQPGTLRRATLFATAAADARLEVVVALSQWVADPHHPAVHAREKWLSTQVMRTTPGLDTVVVNPGWFADNYMAALEPMAQFGVLAMPLGAGLNAPPSNEDIAKVIASVLTDPGSHLGKTYRPTGPRLLTPEHIAVAFSRALGREVRYRDAPLPLFLKAAKSLGYPDFVITQLYWFLQDYQHNAFGVGAPTETVLEVGGAPPEPFEQIAQRYVDATGAARRTIGTRLRATLNLTTALLTRTPDLDAIARRTGLPAITHATLAMDSDQWRTEHLTAATTS